MTESDVDEPQSSSPLNIDGLPVPCEKEFSSEDVVAFINGRFPSEASLESELDAFVASLRGAIESHDAELASIVRAERHGGAKSAHQVASVGTVLDELSEAVAEVQRLAADAERAVDEATAEIRPLDAARRNIAETAHSLGGLVSLEDAVSRCERAAESDNQGAIQELMVSGDGTAILRHIADSLPALKDLHGLVRVPELIDRAVKAKSILREAVVTEFRAALDSNIRPGEMAVLRLKAVCAMANELEPAVKEQISSMFVSTRASSYSAYFDKHPAELEQCDRRFAWIRTELKAYQDGGWANVFPASWNVIEGLCEVVLGLIRSTLTGQLARRKGGDEVDLLLLVLQRSVDFERELDKHFELGTGSANRDSDRRLTFMGIVTSDFEQYLGAYVENEDRSLRELVDRLTREETWNLDFAKQETVLSSSTELFLQIKRTVRRCAALTTNKTFFDLHKVFKIHLKVYASALGQQVQLRKLDRPPNQADAAVASKPTNENSVLSTVCGIIATAEYCAMTVEQLEESLKTQVDQIYAADLSFSDERSIFIDVVSRGIRAIVRLIEIQLEPPMALMLTEDWEGLKEVGDSSEYVSKLREILERSSKLLLGSLSKAQYRVFCERFANSFLPKFHNLVLRCSHRLTDVGAQQILLDVATLKSICLKVVGNESSVGPFVKSVNREIAKTESILKVSLAPLSSIVDTYLTLVPDGSLPDFQKVLALRGIAPSKCAVLVREFSKAKGIEDNAEVARQIQSRMLSSHPIDPAASSRQEQRAGEDGAMDSMRKLLGRFDLSTQLEQTAGKLKDRFTT